MTRRLDEPALQRLRRRLLIGAVVLSAALVLGYLLFVLTRWGQQHDSVAYFSRRAMARHLRWMSSELLDLVQVSTIALGGLVLIIFAALRRRLGAGVVVGLFWAGAILIAELCKWSLSRPMLLTSRGGFGDQSYPSGHATVATSAALAIVLLVPARWRQWVAVGAGIASAIYSSGVVFTGMHRPSDALGAIVLSTASMSLAAVVLLHLWGRRSGCRSAARVPLFFSGVLAVALAALWWTLASGSSRSALHGRTELLVFVAAISATALLATAWFGAQVSKFDWDRSSVPPRSSGC